MLKFFFIKYPVQKQKFKR